MPTDLANHQLVAQLSCPHARPDRSALEFLISEHARETLSLFLDQYDSRLRQTSDGLVSLLSSWCEEPIKFDTAWHMAFGRVHSALLTQPRPGPTEIAVALALRLFECGLQGAWKARLASPARFHFNRWLLPTSYAIIVTADAGQVGMKCFDGAQWNVVEFQRSMGGWKTDDHLDELPVIKFEQNEFLVWTRVELDPPELDDICVNRRSHIPGDIVRRYGTAFGLLRKYSPEYLAWVTDIVRGIVPWDYEPGRFPSGSGSSLLVPGIVGIGAHRHYESLAESLVHEASHQSFMVARRMGPFVDGTDDKLYRNPFLGTDRPIEFIAFAYQAFANILQFCRSALSARPDSSYFIEREKKTTIGLRTLRDGLSSTTSLTRLGKAFLQPLHALED